MLAANSHLEVRASLAPALVRAFFFPGGEEAARHIAGVRIAERGGMRSDPQARPISFTSEQEIDATHSRFRWEARFGG